MTSAQGAARPVIVHATEAMGGGVQSAIAAYTELLGDAEHVVLGRPRSAESTRYFGPNVSVRKREGSLVQFLLWVRGTVLEADPAVVHVHSSLAGAVRLILPRRFRVVYSPHCFSFERTDIGAPKRLAYRCAEAIFARRTDAFVAVSPHEERLCRSMNPRAESIFVPNVVRPNVALGTGDRTPKVVMTGRIGPQKDPTYFGMIARHVVSPVEFVWIGDGDAGDRQRLREAGVTVTGWLEPDEVARAVSRAALYVHTGAWEASPIASMEAASAGTPVLARDIPTMRSLGYAVAGPDVREAAKAVDLFFTDEAFAAKVGRATLAVASEYSRDDARARLAQAYNLPIQAEEPHR